MMVLVAPAGGSGYGGGGYGDGSGGNGGDGGSGRTRRTVQLSLWDFAGADPRLVRYTDCNLTVLLEISPQSCSLDSRKLAAVAHQKQSVLAAILPNLDDLSARWRYGMK